MATDYVSATEAAELLGKNSKTIQRWIASGRLKARKVGRAFQISRSELASVAGRPDLEQPIERWAASASNAYEPAGGSATSGPDAQGDDTALSQLIADLEAQVIEAATSAATWQVKSRILAARLAAAERMVRELELQLAERPRADFPRGRYLSDSQRQQREEHVG